MNIKLIVLVTVILLVIGGVCGFLIYKFRSKGSKCKGNDLQINDECVPYGWTIIGDVNTFGTTKNAADCDKLCREKKQDYWIWDGDIKNDSNCFCGKEDKSMPLCGIKSSKNRLAYSVKDNKPANSLQSCDEGECPLQKMKDCTPENNCCPVINRETGIVYNNETGCRYGDNLDVKCCLNIPGKDAAYKKCLSDNKVLDCSKVPNSSIPHAPASFSCGDKNHFIERTDMLNLCKNKKVGDSCGNDYYTSKCSECSDEKGTSICFPDTVCITKSLGMDFSRGKCVSTKGTPPSCKP